MKLNLTVPDKEKEVEAKFIKVSADVRHWQDATINGESDEDGELTPFKIDGLWQPLIDIDKGLIVNWPEGTYASFHFKICDAGSYYLLDADMNELAQIDNNYVPDGLCHGDAGFGDYIIFSVNEDGYIENYTNQVCAEDWNVDD